MNFLKKLTSFTFIVTIALINFRIIVDYEIIKPTEKYNITKQEKTVAKFLNFSNNQPEEIANITADILQEEKKKEETSEKTDNTQEINNNIEENNSNIIDETVVSTPKTEENKNESVEKQVEQPSEETVQEETKIETTTEEVTSSNSNSIVETAKSYLGSSYVSGGSSPSTGFDCSGFTKYVYGLYGISLNRTASDQADNGTPISKDELQPGDLLLFSYYGSSSIGHTGIYIGDGKFVHAANSNRGVVTDTIESGYYLENYVGARRID